MQRDDYVPQSRKLEIEATRLLRKRGFRPDGRPSGDVEYDQYAFERKFISTPTCGKSSSWRRR